MNGAPAHVTLRTLFALMLTLLGWAGITDHAAATEVDLPRHPSISPDGSEVVFSWRGDLWKVPATGGTAARLTAHPSSNTTSAWSPDGRFIVFLSDRGAGTNLFVMRADGTEPRRLTDLDRPIRLAGVAQKGDDLVVTFDSALEGDVYRDRRPYRVKITGGPVVRVHGAFGSEPRYSADGRRVIFSRGGFYDAWRRRHYRGAESSNIWIHDRDDGSFTQLTTFDGNEGYAQWGGDRTILFLSDREDRTVNLYRMSADTGEQTLARLTHLTDGRNILDFSVCARGETAVLHLFDTLYTLDLSRPDADPVPLRIVAADDETSRETFQTVDRQVSSAALSPDGKVMATIAYGQLFVRNVEDGMPTRRVTNHSGRVTDVAWSPDGVRLYFTSDEEGIEVISTAHVRQTRSEIREAFDLATRSKPDTPEEPAPESNNDEDNGESGTEGDGDEGASGDAPASETDDGNDADTASADKAVPDPARWHDAMTFDIRPLIHRAEPSRNPSPSPCGGMLAFRGLRGHLLIMDLDTEDIRTLREGWDMRLHWSWSPDSRWIAFCENDLNFNADIFIVPADGSSDPINITRHPDNERTPVWSANGKMLAFLSDRINDEFDIWMVYLDPNVDAMSDFDLRAWHDEAAKSAGRIKPLSPDPKKQAEARAKRPEPAFTPEDLEDAYLRLRRVTSYLGNEGNLAITPGGDRFIFSGSDRMSGLHSIKWDGTDLKSLGGGGSVQHVTPSGDRVVLVSGGQAATVRPAGGDRTTISISDTLRIDLETQARQKFLEMSRGLGENYYHHSMHGLDWDAVTETYLTLAKRARTNEEFIWIANQFVGELGGSHLSVRGGPSGPAVPAADRHARLGTIHAPEAGGYRVLEVIARSPAALGPRALQAGDLITGIDFLPLEPTDSIEARLKGRAGSETAVTIERTTDSGETVELTTLLVPIPFSRENQLRYEAWRLENARLVSEWSDGRLGYIHIQAMSQPALDVFERDLFAAADGRDGLILDVRNNGGGWTADRLLTSLMARPHSSTVPRGADPSVRGAYPQDRLFINRYTMPVNLVCNEKSYSNAEIISHAFRTLERGTLVGMPTHGSVISTGGWSLVDGTFVRLPFRGWFIEDGTDRDMELNGAEPHILVPQTPEDEIAGFDRQLHVAVEDLLKRLD